MERDSARQLIHDALAHFYDLPFLPSHPLASRLSHRGAVTPAELQRLLLSAIEQLRPPPSMPAHSPRWRQHHYLRRRYLEGASPKEIQEELGVGDRQARREHQAALQSLAVILGLSTDEAPAITSADLAGARFSNDAEDHGQSSDGAALDAELAWVDRQSPTEVTDLRDALPSVLDLVGPLAARHSVAIEIESPPSTPVLAVRTVLRQLLLNILSHLVTTSARSRVRVLTERSGLEVELRFAIESPRGVASDAPRPSDEPFRHEQPLATARNLAERQGGRLEVYGSASERQVVLVLPAAEVTTVLLIDDNPDVGQLFQRYLQGTGFLVVQARNGPGAFTLAESIDPGVIVLDLMLPVQDGWEIYRQLRSHPSTRALPIIACSVLPERELALSLGVDHFLGKPVTREGLLDALTPYRLRGSIARRGLPSGN